MYCMEQKTETDQALVSLIKEKKTVEGVKQERLRNLIQKAKGRMSERTFAIQLGVSNVTIQNMKHGRFAPSDDTKAKLARFLGWSPEQLEYYLNTGAIPTIDIIDGVLASVYALSLIDLVKVHEVLTVRLREEMNTMFPGSF